MIIGSFEYDENEDTFIGKIITLNFKIERVMIVPIYKDGANGPDYRIKTTTEWDHVELGAAWKRTSEKGNEFISVSLDAPLLDAPLSAALFINEAGDKASMIWNRPKAKKEKKAKKAA